MESNHYNNNGKDKKVRIAELKEEVRVLLEVYGVDSSTTLLRHYAKKYGLTPEEYRLRLVKAQGFDSLEDFLERMSTNGAGFNSYEEYEVYYQKQRYDNWARRKGFASFEDYLENSQELARVLEKVSRALYNEDQASKLEVQMSELKAKTL